MHMERSGVSASSEELVTISKLTRNLGTSGCHVKYYDLVVI